MIKKKSFNDEKLKIIGSRLRNFRGDTSIRKFAQEMEITYSRLGYIECGLTEPTLNEISKYQKKFNVSYDYLLGLTDESTIDIKIKTINKKYGLTEKSLKNLEKINIINVDFSNKASTLINTINILLSEEFDFESRLSILEMIDSYIHKNSNIFYEIYSNGDIILKNTKKSKNEYFHGKCEINASLFSENMLPKITERLVELKKEGEKNECEGTRKKQKI